MNSLVSVGRDGTNVKTDRKNGIKKRIEDALVKPVHWFVCILHSNELTLCHLFNFLDGKTSEPRNFTGPIGKEPQKSETKAVDSITPIKVPAISIDNADLSADQKYLLEMYDAVSRACYQMLLQNDHQGV